MRPVDRRTFLAGAGAAALAPGSAPQPVSRDGQGDATQRLADGRFRSRHMGGAEVGWSIAYPPGQGVGSELPVVVALHGRGATHRTAFDVLHLDAVLDRVVSASQVPPFALAAVDGGDHGYWHRRADGTDAGAMVVEELVPLLRTRGLDTGRLGLYGWSMGGYGALLLAGRGRLRARAVAVASPALFSTSGNTPPGAFDNAADYLRNDVYSHPGRLDGVPLRVDCGRSDPFYVATRDFVARLPTRPAGAFGEGGHDPAYWRGVAPDELAFLGAHLD
jgi:enterochelin esterase-like enzyme